MLNSRKAVLSLAVLALSSIAAFGQTTMSSTTLSAPITSTDAGIILLASVSGITVPGAATGTTIGGPNAPYNETFLFIDREVMRVNALPNGNYVQVERGVNGTRATYHNANAIVYLARPSSFSTTDLYGSCTRQYTSSLVLPQINPDTGGVFNCVNTANGYQWVAYTPAAGVPPVVGAAIASASTIAPTAPVTHITGTGAVATITVPPGFPSGGQITLVADGAYTWTAGSGAGQIKVASAAGQVVGTSVTFTYDGNTNLWYPSHQ